MAKESEVNIILPPSALEASISLAVSLAVKHADNRSRYLYRDDASGDIVLTSMIAEQQSTLFTPIADVFPIPTNGNEFLRKVTEFIKGGFYRGYISRGGNWVTIYQRGILRQGVEVLDAEVAHTQDGTPVIHNLRSKGALTEAVLRRAAKEYPLWYEVMQVLSQPRVASDSTKYNMLLSRKPEKIKPEKIKLLTLLIQK